MPKNHPQQTNLSKQLLLMNSIKKFLITLVTSSRIYGVSALNEDNAKERPQLATFCSSAIDVINRRQSFLVWKRTKHKEWIWILFFPIWFRWIDDEIHLIGEIAQRGDAYKITSYDGGFTEWIQEYFNRKCQIHQESITSKSWTWNPARSEWSPKDHSRHQPM